MGIDVVEERVRSGLGMPLRTSDGRASAKLSAGGAGIEVVCDGALVLAIEPRRGQLTLRVAEGDLRLVAERGAVELLGADGVRLTGATAEIATDRFELSAERAAFRVGEWDLAADRIRERAVNVVRDVQQTLHTSADQIRTRVRGLFQLASHRTSLRSEDNTAIDGKRVLLG